MYQARVKKGVLREAQLGLGGSQPMRGLGRGGESQTGSRPASLIPASAEKRQEAGVTPNEWGGDNWRGSMGCGSPTEVMS